MLIIKRKDAESIDRLVKRYKRKRRKVKLMNELRQRKTFEKPSVKRRTEVLKAIYSQDKMAQENH